MTYITSNANLTINTYNQTGVSFNGINQFINMSNEGFLNPYSNYSYSLWYQVKGNTTGISPVLFRTNKYYRSSIAYTFQSVVNGNYRLNDVYGNPISSINGKIYNFSNNWMFLTVNVIALNSTTGNASLFENSRFHGSTLFNLTSAPSQSIFKLGSFDGSTHFHNGSIDDVKVFNRTLTNNEISSLYFQGKPFITNCPIGTYLYSILDNKVTCNNLSIITGNIIESLNVQVNNGTDIQNKINICSRSGCNLTILSGDYAINNTINLTSNLTININNGARLYWNDGAVPDSKYSVELAPINYMFYANGINNLEIFNYGNIQPQLIFNPITFSEMITFIDNSSNINIKGGTITGNTTIFGYSIYNSNNISVYDTYATHTDGIYWGECNNYINLNNFDGIADSFEGEAIESNMGDNYLTINDVNWIGGNDQNDQTVDINAAKYVSINNVTSTNANRILTSSLGSGIHFGRCNNTATGISSTVGNYQIITNAFCYNCNYSADVSSSNLYYIQNNTPNINYFNYSSQLDSIILNLPFNEDSGIIAQDISSNMNNGTLINGVGWLNDGNIITTTLSILTTLTTSNNIILNPLAWIYNYLISSSENIPDNYVLFTNTGTSSYNISINNAVNALIFYSSGLAQICNGDCNITLNSLEYAYVYDNNSVNSTKYWSNALAFDNLTKQVFLSSNINSNDGYFNNSQLFNFSNNVSIILDNFNITEGISRTNSPIWFSSSSSTSKHIASNLTNTVNITVSFDVDSCSIRYLTYISDTGAVSQTYNSDGSAGALAWTSCVGNVLTLSNILVEPATGSGVILITYNTEITSSCDSMNEAFGKFGTYIGLIVLCLIIGVVYGLFSGQSMNIDGGKLIQDYIFYGVIALTFAAIITVVAVVFIGSIC